MSATSSQYLTTCTACGGTTSRKHARTHGGLCKLCTMPHSTPQAPARGSGNRNARMLDSGYQAYAREEGYYDGGN